MHIGIMGGTFDPIHLGHLLAAETVREEAGLDQIWFMPSHIPPHKSATPVASNESRWEMVCRAVKDHPDFYPLDIELKRGGTSYTYDTVRSLLDLYPDHQFRFIIGGDMVATLPKWYKIEELVSLIGFIGLERPGTTIDWETVGASLARQIQMVAMPALDISSTEIRWRRQCGKSVRYMVHEQVWQYMEEHRLYEPV